MPVNFTRPGAACRWPHLLTKAATCSRARESVAFRSSGKGFALVLALTLMAFVLLLAISMGTLLMVEVQFMNHARASEIARQNARFAMLLALGEIQMHLGQDTRSSARAEILEPDPLSALEHPRWTGVWSLPHPDDRDDYPDGLDPRRKPELVTWLVSGDGSFSPDSALTNANSVIIASSVPGDPGNGYPDFKEVRVPRVEISGGAYGFWVEDEGLKVKLSAVAENHDPDGRPLMPLWNGSEMFPELAGITDSDDPVGSWRGLYDLTLAIDQAESGADPVETVSRLSPHTTLHGFGVLSDSLRGGLRLDLSSIVRMNRSAFAAQIEPLLPGDFIYEEYLGDFNYPGMPTWDGKGPAWDLLRQYGSLADGYGPAGAPVRLQEVTGHTGPEMSGLSIIEAPGVFPVIDRFQLYMVARLSGDLEPGNTENAVFRPRLYYLPAVVLWNPYDKPLVATGGLVLRWLNIDNTNGWGHNYAAGTFDTGNKWAPLPASNNAEQGRFPHSHSKGNSNTTFFLLRGSASNPDIVIPPGQAIVFTMVGNEAMDPDPDAAKEFEMRPGFRSFGFWLDAEDTFSVPRTSLDSEDWQGVYLDIRTRIDKWVNNSWVEDDDTHSGFTFQLLDEQKRILQRLEWLLLDPATRQMANRPTVSSGYGYGATDPFGSAPFPVTAGDLRTGTVPALDTGSGESIAVGYEIGLRKPNPYVAIHGSYTFHGARPLASHNPRASRSEGEWTRKRSMNIEYYQYVVFENQQMNFKGNQTYVIQTWDEDATAAYLGYSDLPSGTEQFALFHLPGPNEPLHSVGQLRHLDLVGNNGTHSDQAVGGAKLDGGPAFVIGEARADPFIPLNAYAATVNIDTTYGGASRHADHQWLANRQIWDRFFVSTVPGGDPVFPLENGRIVYYAGETGADLHDPLTAAASLLVDGSFNINSTSVPAWRALLGQFVGQPVQLADGTEVPDSAVSPFIDLPEPFSAPYTTGRSPAPELYSGYRQLDPDQIDLLAKEIVRLIRERGPFVSLADFINRSVDPGDLLYTDTGSNLHFSASPKQLALDPRIFGLLQAAIESADLNQDFHYSHPNQGGDYVMIGMPPWQTHDGGRRILPAALGAFMEGAPGYMTQGKLLQRLGPILSARSDIFRIRAYGEARNPLSGDIEATAYAEAIVQRLPEFLDEADPAETRIKDLTSDINRTLGRRFQIIAFRWLNESEI